MEIIVEIIVQLLWEVLLQAAFEGLFELLGHSFKRSPDARPVPAWVAALGYAALGAIAGGISLWLVPDLFIEKGWLRWLNLLVVPVAAGALMGALGAWRRKRDLRVIRLDSFAYGYCFALAMSVVRFVWGH